MFARKNSTTFLAVRGFLYNFYEILFNSAKNSIMIKILSGLFNDNALGAPPRIVIQPAGENVTFSDCGRMYSITGMIYVKLLEFISECRNRNL